MRAKKHPQAKPKAVGSYIFAGGFTIGMMDHFDIVCHLENGNYGVATVEKNFEGLPVYTDPKEWPLEWLQGVPVVYGNPACAAWSQAGYTASRGTDKWRTDPRLQQTLEHFSLLEKLQPDIWCWESVCLAYTKGKEFVKELEARAKALGYSVTYFFHDTQWMGLPQVRKRFMMICHRVELELPMHNWAPAPEPLEVMQAAALAGFNRPSEPQTAVQRRWTAQKLKKVPPGGSLRKHWEQENPIGHRIVKADGKIQGRPSFGLRRLPVGKPGGSVVGYSLVHPTEHRWISTQEMQLLSGFPLDYQFAPARPEAIEDEIARGVCPPVGAYLGKAFASALERNRRLSTSVVREIDYRRPPLADESLINILP